MMDTREHRVGGIEVVRAPPSRHQRPSVPPPQVHAAATSASHVLSHTLVSRVCYGPAPNRHYFVDQSARCIKSAQSHPRELPTRDWDQLVPRDQAIYSFTIQHGAMPPLHVRCMHTVWRNTALTNEGLDEALEWLQEDTYDELLGFDTESSFGPDASVRLIQLSTTSRCLLLRVPERQLVANRSTPLFSPGFRRLLADRSVRKAGAGAWLDARELYREFGFVVNGCTDLSRVYKRPAGGPMSLEDMCAHAVPSGAFLKDRESTCSDWGAEVLTLRQMIYAALDAQASYMVAARTYDLPEQHIADADLAWLERPVSFKADDPKLVRNVRDLLPTRPSRFQSVTLHTLSRDFVLKYGQSFRKCTGANFETWLRQRYDSLWVLDDGPTPAVVERPFVDPTASRLDQASAALMALRYTFDRFNDISAHQADALESRFSAAVGESWKRFTHGMSLRHFLERHAKHGIFTLHFYRNDWRYTVVNIGDHKGPAVAEGVLRAGEQSSSSSLDEHEDPNGLIEGVTELLKNRADQRSHSDNWIAVSLLGQEFREKHEFKFHEFSGGCGLGYWLRTGPCRKYFRTKMCGQQLMVALK